MNKKTIILAFSCAFILYSCKDQPTPKKTGYFRIDLPAKEYHKVDSIPFPFEFDLPQYADVNLKRTKEDAHFFNIDFLPFAARLHMSYIPIDSNLPKLLEDSRELVFKHTIKAQDIREKVYANPEGKVFGIYYDIIGNAASPSQFFLTDSVQHFLRGALYFNVSPNPDSLQPVVDFLEKDILHLMESFSWDLDQKDLK